MACKIFRDENNNIVSVLDSQGNPSKLYQQALQKMGEEEALEVAMVPYTETYEQVNGVQSLEPSFRQVQEFMSRYNNEQKRLDRQDIDALRNNTLSMPYSTIEEIYTQLEELYPQGIFTLTEQTLRKTDLYTTAEIREILSDTDSQQRLAQISKKIRADVSLNDRNLDDINSNLALYETPELTDIKNTEELVGIQKFEQVNPFIEDTRLRSILGGIKDRNVFEDALNTAGEAYIEKYYSDSQYAERFFNTYSSMDRMPRMQDSEEGLQYATSSNIEQFTEQALIVGRDNTQLLGTLDYLRGIPREVWINSGIEIEDMLLRIEDSAADIGIDVIGISEQQTEYEDMIRLLDSIANMVRNPKTRQDFYDNYNSVFQNDSGEYTAEVVNPSNRGRKLVKLDTYKTEEELFEWGLLKTVNEGVYHRISKIENLDSLYDYVTDLVQFNPNSVEKRAIPSAFKSNGQFSYQKATDSKNREDMKADLQRYARQQGMAEEMVLYKIAFGHPIKFPQYLKTMPSRIEGDFDYLTQDFIADFARQYLQEKSVDSEAFRKFYSHFSFNERGIILKDADPYSLQELKLNVPKAMEKDFRNYSQISKDPILNGLYPQQVDRMPSIQIQREFYMNNPEQLAEKALQFELSESGNNLAVQNLQDNFIRANGVVWERVKDYKNITVYQRLPDIVNPLYSQYGLNVNIDAQVNMQEFNPLAQTLENMASIEKMYGTKEAEQINSEKQC